MRYDFSLLERSAGGSELAEIQGGGFREWIWRYSALLYLVTVRDELRGARDRLFFLSWVVGFQVVRKNCE